MRLRASLITCSVCVAAITGMLFACKPDATPRTKEAKDWIDKFYTRYTIRGYWGFFGAEAKDKNINVEINVPEQQARDLMKLSEDERKQFIARNACPPRDQEVWSIMEPDGDIIVHTRLNGNVFAETSCRNNPS